MINAVRSRRLLAACVCAAAAMAFGCGADMTVRKIETTLAEPAPSSAAVLSGAATSTGGEHYKAVRTLGAPISKPVQESADGKYKVR